MTPATANPDLKTIEARTVPYSLRASVATTCNMACHYCPRYTSMEDYTPDQHRGRGLTNDDYLSILTGLLSALRFAQVSLTGGEPTINPHLGDIAAAARPLTDRLELNTNGLTLTTKRWEQLAPWFDRVKMSLDTLDPALFKEITESAGNNPLARVLAAIDLITDSGIELALNCVVSRDTIGGLDELIAFAARKGVRLHLLDYYFTEERRDNWQQQFIPIESLMPTLQQRYGQPQQEPVFGCGFYRYDLANHVDEAVEHAVLRIKTSYSGTMRAPRCATCSHYCQEGMYGLKLSTDGWVTTCPSNEEEDGVLLQPDMAPGELLAALAPLLVDLDNTKYQPDSMQTLVEKRGLHLESDQIAPTHHDEWQEGQS